MIRRDSYSQPHSPKSIRRLYQLAVISLCASLLTHFLFLNRPVTEVALSQSSEYEARKAQLLTKAAQSFVDDPNRNVETELDGQSFQEINKLACPKPVNIPRGWSIEMRTGGRPFMNFDSININGNPWTLVQCTPGTSTITQPMLDAHYAAGKRVNRLWLVHPTRCDPPKTKCV